MTNNQKVLINLLNLQFESFCDAFNIELTMDMDLRNKIDFSCLDNEEERQWWRGYSYGLAEFADLGSIDDTPQYQFWMLLNKDI